MGEARSGAVEASSEATIDRTRARMELLEALRSGTYSQTRCRLRDEKGFSCLGVACDVAAKHGIGWWVEVQYAGSPAWAFITSRDVPREPGSTIGSAIGATKIMTDMPEEVYEAFGLQDPLGPEILGWESSANAEDHGASLADIADAWEQEWGIKRP